MAETLTESIDSFLFTAKGETDGGEGKMRVEALHECSV